MEKRLRVLVVDDNPQDRRLVLRELRKAYPFAEIYEAVDQPQLDEQLEFGGFDAVVTDFHLHWSDGIRVLQAVKRRFPHCPVIMFTGTGNEEIAVEAMKQGLDDYIIKNVKHLVRLRGAVTAAVEHAKTKAKVFQLASRLESLLSQLRVGVFTCSPEGRFLDMNDAMADLLAQESDAEGPKSDLSSMFSMPDEAQRFLSRVVESGEPQESDITTEATGSSARCFRINAKLVHGDREPPRIDGIVEDVTRRKKSEDDARQVAVAVAKMSMLSPREREVLGEVVDGNANKLIARHLDISEKTVEKHRSSLMKKLRVRSVAELVRIAMLAESTEG